MIGGTPSISVTKNGITFSKSAIAKIDYPKYVKIYLNENSAQMAIKPCDDTDDDKVSFVKTDKKTINNVRWNNREFNKQIIKLMDVSIDGNAFRIDAEYISEENILLFDLKNHRVSNDNGKDDSQNED